MNYQIYKGPVPQVVAGFRILKDTRFASGNFVFQQRLNALQSKDLDEIVQWGVDFSFPDACFGFENLLKVQLNSPFLTALCGVVKKEDGLYVAVDAQALKSALTETKPFEKQYSHSERAQYCFRNQLQETIIEDVVLLPYTGTLVKNVQLNADQFYAVKGKKLQREDMINESNLKKSQLLKNDKVIHPIWALYNKKVIVPLIKETFAYGKKKCDNQMMGFFLPDEPKDHAELWSFQIADIFKHNSMLYTNGNGQYSSVVGIERKIKETD